MINIGRYGCLCYHKNDMEGFHIANLIYWLFYRFSVYANIRCHICDIDNVIWCMCYYINLRTTGFETVVASIV